MNISKRKKTMITMLLSLFTLALIVYIFILKINNQDSEHYITSTELRQININDSEKTITKKLGKPVDINQNSKEIILDLKKYNELIQLSPSVVSSKLIHASNRINTTSVENVTSKLSNKHKDNIELIKYNYEKKDDGSVMFLFDNNKLIFVFTID